ncbi:MAG TPA: DUF3800 domain-containing protein [Polyangiaceae bacterium]|nr:DUF3800 domain-containing protein [Polyangiaceae bacterium]
MSETTAGSRVIFIDECGHTGEDLSDADQPVMVVASHSFAESNATELKQKHFGKVRSKELKHLQLQRRPVHQRAIVGFLEEVLAHECVCVAIAHKPYCSVLKIIDWLIEPGMHRAGLKLYERGGHIALANILQVGLLAQGGDLFARVTQSFEQAVRTRDPIAIRRCFHLLVSREVTEALAPLPNPFARGIIEMGDDLVEQLPPGALDISMALAMQVCTGWRERGWTAFTVYHDRSSVLARNKDVWDALLSEDAPQAKVGWGTRVVQYPIGVEETRLVESQCSDGVQLADVIAGAFSRWGRWLLKEKPADDPYSASLEEVLLPRLENCVTSSIWPSLDIQPWATTSDDVRDPNEFSASILRKRDLTLR